MKLRYYIFSAIIFILLIFCITSPTDMIDATKNGLTLWFSIVIPSLFPFLILSDLIQKTAITRIFSKLLSPIMIPLFRLPGISSFAIFLGMTGGYPIGAKTTYDLRKNNSLSQIEARRLISFSNNSGPLFISGAIGIGLYKNPTIGLLLLLSHYISAIFVGFFFRFYKTEENKSTTKNNIQFEIIELSKIGELLSNTIKKACSIVVTIGGFIILFSIISSILEKTGILIMISRLIMPKLPTELSTSLLTGILEVTNGVNKISSLSTIGLFEKIIITSALIGFGGFSVHMQTLSVLSDSDIGISTYFIGKTMQGIISAIVSYLLLYYTKFSLLITQATFSTEVYNTRGFIKLISVITIAFLFIVIFKIIQVILYDKNTYNKY